MSVSATYKLICFIKLIISTKMTQKKGVREMRLQTCHLNKRNLESSLKRRLKDKGVPYKMKNSLRSRRDLNFFMKKSELIRDQSKLKLESNVQKFSQRL